MVVVGDGYMRDIEQLQSILQYATECLGIQLLYLLTLPARNFDTGAGKSSNISTSVPLSTPCLKYSPTKMFGPSHGQNSC